MYVLLLLVCCIVVSELHPRVRLFIILKNQNLGCGSGI